MHILYIHQYFTTPLGRIGVRSYEFARRWVASGHRVTMLTSTAQLSSEDLAESSGRFFKRLKIDDIDVIALAVPYSYQMSVPVRCGSFLLFLILASATVLFLRGIDVIYATSTPLTIGVPALVAKWLRRKKYVFEVRDHWPKSIVELGVIKNRFIISMLYRLEKIIYRNSSAIVAVSEGMAKDIRLVAGDKPVYSVTNGCDLDTFSPNVDGSSFREDHGLVGKFVFVHAGSMGKINDLDFVIRAAERVRDIGDLVFVLIGDGTHKPFLQKRVNSLGLTNVLILPAMIKEELATALAASDVVMAIIAKYPIIERHASLNKFYDGLSAGKAILLNYSGWQREMIEEFKAGFGGNLCNLDDFVSNIKHISSKRGEIKTIGHNARKLGLEKFGRQKLAMQALEVITSMEKK
jgi:glycosyltransferase involved in cell wall biosynthesis